MYRNHVKHAFHFTVDIRVLTNSRCHNDLVPVANFQEGHGDVDKCWSVSWLQNLGLRSTASTRAHCTQGQLRLALCSTVTRETVSLPSSKRRDSRYTLTESADCQETPPWHAPSPGPVADYAPPLFERSFSQVLEELRPKLQNIQRCWPSGTGRAKWGIHLACAP